MSARQARGRDAGCQDAQHQGAGGHGSPRQDAGSQGAACPDRAGATRQSAPADSSAHGNPGCVIPGRSGRVACGGSAPGNPGCVDRGGSSPGNPGCIAHGNPTGATCRKFPNITLGDSNRIAHSGSVDTTRSNPVGIGGRLRPRCVLSIAGSDPSGGAGIQADIKTIAAHGLYAQAVPAVLTAQNTMGVIAVHTLPPSFVRAQIEAVLADGEPDAIKIGMLGDANGIRAVAAALAHTRAPIVLDPIMVSSSGTRLLAADAIEVLVRELMGRAALITPNIPEAQVLAGTSLTDRAARERAARHLACHLGCSVLIKGGHADASGPAADCLAEHAGNGMRISWFEHERIEGPGAHGTGCTLSSAIACGLACGHDLARSVRDAKAYLTGALAHPLELGHGTPPVNHLWRNIDAPAGAHAPVDETPNPDARASMTDQQR